MIGSEKQITWAMDIRDSIIKTCDANISRFADTIPETANLYRAIKVRCEKFLEMIDNHPSTKEASKNAKWWIDNKDRLPNPIRVAETVETMIGNGRTQEESLQQLFGF